MCKPCRSYTLAKMALHQILEDIGFNENVCRGMTVIVYAILTKQKQPHYSYCQLQWPLFIFVLALKMETLPKKMAAILGNW